MLAIRMQRTGRRGHAQFRVIVQDSRFHPKRGKVVAYLGSYNPHSKAAQIDKDTAKKYLSNGAQPSDRVAKLLKAEGVKLPSWVKLAPKQKKAIKNPEKMRRNRPAGEPAPIKEKAKPSEEVEAQAAEEKDSPDTEAPAEAKTPPTEAPAEEATPEAPAEKPADEEKLAEAESAQEPAKERAKEENSAGDDKPKS